MHTSYATCERIHEWLGNAAHCNTLQHTAAHCSTLQLTATHRNSPQHTFLQRQIHTLQHTATHCNAPQLTATPCNIHYCSDNARLTCPRYDWFTHCNNTLQHTTIHCSHVLFDIRHCNSLQHTSVHDITGSLVDCRWGNVCCSELQWRVHDMTGSHVLFDIHTCDMSHSYAWHALFSLHDLFTTCWYVLFDVRTCVTWPIDMGDVTYHVLRDIICSRRVRLCSLNYEYVWHDLFICVTWLIHTRHMTHSHEWHV